MALARQALLRLGAPRFQLAQRRHFSNLLASDGPRPRIYISHDSDPYVNLSIEHYLLQKSHPDSTILFLYRNRPCVVIGRNQNPWLEVNLGRLCRGIPDHSPRDSGIKFDGAPTPGQEPPNQTVSLVRRRSGGGTVFHDEGNVNWMVICPPAAFDRDRHAEMVARALSQRLGVAGVRVNCRHDIVKDVGAGVAGSPPDSEKETYKVSGSAYKLTRLRSLHHGTCLLSSANLTHISKLLRSPAEPFIKARGVESVRSKVRNVDVGYEDFVAAVRHEFKDMYGEIEGGDVVVGRAALELPEVRKGVEELQVCPNSSVYVTHKPLALICIPSLRNGYLGRHHSLLSQLIPPRTTQGKGRHYQTSYRQMWVYPYAYLH
jgi:lipoate-protein ligase A